MSETLDLDFCVLRSFRILAGSFPSILAGEGSARDKGATHALSACAGPTFPAQEMAEDSPFLFQPHDWREVGLATALISNFSLQTCERINFCYYKSPSLWSVILSQLGFYGSPRK